MAHKNFISMKLEAIRAQKLGANEQAILDKIPVKALRNIVVNIVRIKMYLQFTGWLQYMLPMIVAIFVFMVAGIMRLLSMMPVANLFAIIGFIVLGVFLFDLITVKYKLRFPESLPQSNDHLNIFDLMRVRRSCRSFQTRELTSSHYDQLTESVRLHSKASTIGKSPIRFEYITAPLAVWPTVNATEFLIAIAPSKYDRTAVIDVGRTLQKIVMDVTRMGLATCWIGPGADRSSIQQHLADRFDPNEDHIICVCALGYKSSYIPLFLRIFNRQFYRRIPISSLFFADSQFQEPLNINKPPFNQFRRTYEICQWAPSSYNGQTTRCVGIIEENASNTIVRFDFYASTASRYYAAVAVGIWCANWEMGCEELGIHGHFDVLSELESVSPDETDHPQLPTYDLSWMSDDSI